MLPREEGERLASSRPSVFAWRQPGTGDYSRSAVGQWIENGEFAYPIEEITIAGNLLAMYDSIEVIGSDLDLRHSVVAPTIKIARLTVAGN